MSRIAFFCCLLLVSSWCQANGGGGYDTPTGAATTLELLGPDRPKAPQPERTWLRLRGVNGLRVPLTADAEPAAQEARAAEIASDRADLAELRAAGYRLAGLLRWWHARDWSAVRAGPNAPGSQAPLNLLEAYHRTYALGKTYGDLMDFWEVENEPEIFFAETADVFAAFHKAVAWGFWHGRAAAQAAGGQGTDAVGRVLMAAPALPPGPHFAQLQANGHLAYTEGFNYHYYGFAEDFGGVYDHFKLSTGARSVGLVPWLRDIARKGTAGEDSSPRTRRWPVLISEWGYSFLDGYDAQTVAGRVAQWRFFRDVAEQQADLRIAGPMAFLLQPYYEHGMREYGLGMPTDERRATHYGFALPVPAREITAGTPAYRTGGLIFTPEDFYPERPGAEAWMTRIGEAAGEGIEASPALAWLRADAAARERAEEGQWRLRTRAGATGKAARGASVAERLDRSAGDWLVQTEAPSPVVADLIAGDGVTMVKSYHGYWLSDARDAGHMSGEAELVWYNFGQSPAQVRWSWPAGMTAADPATPTELQLAPGERRVLAVRLSAPRGRFVGQELTLAAQVNGEGGATTARWATRLYAAPTGYGPTRALPLDFATEQASQSRARLLARPLASEEPPLIEHPQSRWLTTAGATVEDTDQGFTILIQALPGVGTRPVVVELPLPEWPAFGPGLTWSYDYRLRPAWPGERSEELRPDHPDPTQRRLIGRLGLVMESYFRTAEGNLLSTQPRLIANETWKTYHQPWESFTPHFLGRTTPPDPRAPARAPAALVFFIRPTRLPAVVEIRRPTLCEWSLPQDEGASR